MKRRDLLVLGVVAVASPVSLGQPARIPRIGALAIPPLPGFRLQMAALMDGLRQHGYVEGKNVAIEYRSANGNYELLRAHADELVASKVDVIVAFGTPPSQAAKAATTTIPIVMAGVGDPIGTGLVSSANPSNPAQVATIRAAEMAAAPLKMELSRYDVTSLDDIRRAFTSMQSDRVEGLVLGNDPLLITHAATIAEAATKQRLRSAGNREFALRDPAVVSAAARRPGDRMTRKWH